MYICVRIVALRSWQIGCKKTWIVFLIDTPLTGAGSVSFLRLTIGTPSRPNLSGVFYWEKRGVAGPEQIVQLRKRRFKSGALHNATQGRATRRKAANNPISAISTADGVLGQFGREAFSVLASQNCIKQMIGSNSKVAHIFILESYYYGRQWLSPFKCL